MVQVVRRHLGAWRIRSVVLLALAATLLSVLSGLGTPRAHGTGGTGQISGEVSGARAADLTVELLTLQHSKPGTFVGVVAATQVARDGRYSFAGLDPATYWVRVRDTSGRKAATLAPDVRTTEEVPASVGTGARTIALRKGAQVVADVVMQERVGVSGTTRTADGKPVEGADVALRGVHAGQDTTVWSSTDRRGRWKIEVVPRGKYVVQVIGRDAALRDSFHPGVDDRADAEVVTVGDTAISLDLTALPGATVTGTVDLRGAEAAAVTVHLHRRTREREKVAWVTVASSVPAADSTWSIGAQRPGVHRVTLTSDVYQDTAWGGSTLEEGADVRLEAGGSVDGIDLVARPRPRLTGTLRDVDGDRVPGVLLEFSPTEPGTRSLTATTDWSGRFFVEGLSTGSYRARAAAGDDLGFTGQWLEVATSEGATVRTFTADEDAVRAITLRWERPASDAVAPASGTALDRAFLHRLGATGEYTPASPLLSSSAPWLVTLLPSTYRLSVDGMTDWIGPAGR